MDESAHFLDVLAERDIRREWVELTVARPERVEDHGDRTRHFLCRIPDHGQRWLRVVVNVAAEPPVLVTVFFDRRLRRLP
jgi:hypothetical protein